MPSQPLSRQQRGTDDDEKRPQIGDQTCLDRWRIAQGGEVEEMVAKKACDADDPHLGWLPQKSQPMRPRSKKKKAWKTANREADRGKLEGRHLSGRRCH
jgi:hypothetical protein